MTEAVGKRKIVIFIIGFILITASILLWIILSRQNLGKIPTTGVFVMQCSRALARVIS